MFDTIEAWAPIQLSIKIYDIIDNTNVEMSIERAKRNFTLAIILPHFIMFLHPEYRISLNQFLHDPYT